MKRRFTALLLFVWFWTLGVLVMTWTYYAHPDPGTGANGTTYQGELATMLGVTTLQVAVFGALLRPWSYQRSWDRAVGSLLILTPCIPVWMIMNMHAGPTSGMNVMWLMLFWVGLLGAAVVSGVAAWRARRTARATAP